MTTAHYFARRAYGEARARQDVRDLTALLALAPLTRRALEEAFASPQPDFEDAVLAHAAFHAGATGVVTRDRAGFTGGPLQIYTPPDALSVLASREADAGDRG